ncbi:ankyrin-1-like [Trichogramma pretiosum]|uniref:ankyrin-1-like n=1 Tax=Trichogramma pretiosum TaxID=7493 RepID=UPI000C7188F8|nr:ankyrin-1-like [Trichogramma pretiosum]
MAQDDDSSLKKLQTMREKVDWSNEKERYPFFHDLLFNMIKTWKGPLPNFRDMFRTRDMDWLLTESLNHMHNIDDLYLGCPFVIFVASCGYRDKPEMDEKGKPILRRTTPLHRAAKQKNYACVRELFKIYNWFNANYIDEDGFTHFHAACLAGCDDVVGQFLKLGQDPDCLAQKFAYPPLHLAVVRCWEKVTRLLLDSGADQNRANVDGFTPLHMLSLSEFPLTDKIFFKINDEKNLTVELDARDKKGRTPLEWAVANIRPLVVEALLDRGADLSSFVFPTEAYFGSKFRRDYNILSFRGSARLATDVLLIVEILKERGYELSRSDALTIMKFFAHIGKPRKIVYEDGYKEYCAMCETDDKATAGPFCGAHQSTILSKMFFQHWANEFLSTLSCHRLPTVFCEVFLDQLKNEDLLRMCTAVEIVLKEQSQTQDDLEKVDKFEEFPKIFPRIM